MELKKILEEIMVENFSNLAKDTSSDSMSKG